MVAAEPFEEEGEERRGRKKVESFARSSALLIGEGEGGGLERDWIRGKSRRAPGNKREEGGMFSRVFTQPFDSDEFFEAV